MKNHPATKPAPKELSAAELEIVTGGKGAGKADFNFTHTVDKASPVLLMFHSLGV
jgi:type VI protein secretion system component Hcp